MSGINLDRAEEASAGRDQITRSTTEEPKQEKQGRPPELKEPHRTTVTLEERQVNYLDRTCGKIMATEGEKLSRSTVIRSLLDGLINRDIDYSEVTSETDLRRLFDQLLG